MVFVLDIKKAKMMMNLARNANLVNSIFLMKNPKKGKIYLPNYWEKKGGASDE